MTLLHSHLTTLERVLPLDPSAPAFRIPIFNKQNSISGYSIVTYANFHQDVVRYALYWSTKLESSGIEPRSVVGLCVKGLSYTDVLHIYGLGMAGYVVQCFSLFPSAIDVVASLLKRSTAKAFIYEEGHFNASALGTTDVSDTLKVYQSVNRIPEDFVAPEGYSFPAQNNRPEDIAIMFHSTGSTSGTPKFIPTSFKTLDAWVSKAAFTCAPADPKRRDVNSWIGSVCHVGQFGFLLSNIYHGACTVQQTSATPSADEVKAMVKLGSLNRACMFPALVARLLKESRHDSELLAALASLDSIIHGGAIVPKDDEEWARAKGVNLVNIYACSELGIPVLLSSGLRVAQPDYLLPIPVTRNNGTPLLSYKFETVPGEADSVDLKTMVVLSSSGDIPDESLCNSNGYYETGDLFEEGEPGKYVYRGRNDDWIKMANACKCDAASIETDIRKTCGDLIAECLIVGTNRRSPALLVELDGGSGDASELKEQIYRRIAASEAHSRRLPHERIVSGDMILIVPSGSLMRTATKGNVRRRATEEAMREQLDQVYQS
ncbi:hypothetical protein VNI00_008142 [Paramarasmius palmivorus]|uniref:AMP-dependent synthetase/ligase domain-containing protein n=1 Tax=Paramarasmius palmivorus TaxID=297713 RepID=A0AAW0CXX1_9AGAR